MFRKLQELDISKSPGPDGWHQRFLKESAEQLTVPLCVLFRKFLDSGFIPNEWKIAHVTPVFKKGNRQQSSNYRPISLTSALCKVFESILKDGITEFFATNHLLADEQYGFRAGRSCATQLLFAMDNWTDALQQGIPIDVIYLDFSKAFDSVPHQRLLVKLKAYGVQGKLLNWIEAFLTHRQQRVVINNAKSDFCDVISGVLQGSVLGPLPAFPNLHQ